MIILVGERVRIYAGTGADHAEELVYHHVLNNKERISLANWARDKYGPPCRIVFHSLTPDELAEVHASYDALLDWVERSKE